MTEVAGLARLDVLSQRYGTRPSALAGVTDPYTAYCVDEACALAAGDWRATEPEDAPPQRIAVDGVPLLMGTIRRED